MATPSGALCSEQIEVGRDIQGESALPSSIAPLAPEDRQTQNADSRPPGETPLPKMQLTLLLLTMMAEPISSTVILPFVNQLVQETGVTGGDERKTGYFAGLIVSSLFLS